MKKKNFYVAYYNSVEVARDVNVKVCRKKLKYYLQLNGFGYDSRVVIINQKNGRMLKP